MMRGRWILGIAVAAVVFWASYQKLNVRNDAKPAPPSSNSSGNSSGLETGLPLIASVLPAQKSGIEQDSKSDFGVRLNAENRNELQRCELPFGSEIVTLDDAFKAIAQPGGEPSKRDLNWINIHFRTIEGENRRLRVWSEYLLSGRRKLRVQLFTLDEEGFPVPVSIPDDEVEGEGPDAIQNSIQKYLDRAEILETQERESLSFGEPSSLTIRVETENGSVRALEIKDGATEFQCATAPQADSTECKCLSHGSR